MTTFTIGQQQNHRHAFIKECRQKASGAACHADWIAKQVDQCPLSGAPWSKVTRVAPNEWVAGFTPP
jgi:hypothetical protein